MTERDKKTIRLGTIAVAVYLAVFSGYKMWRRGAAGQNDYSELAKRATQLLTEVRAQENRVLLFDKLFELYKFDPRKIKGETLVADASAAIQSSAQQGGIQLGPFRESPARNSNRELTTIQIEGTGPVPAALALLHHLRTLGYPLLIDSVQFGPAQNRPGQVKINVSITILNFDRFKEGIPDA